MNEINTSSATVTIYRAKARFEYQPGVWIEQGEQWTPQGERNDRQIMEHLCYEDKVPLSDLLKEENGVESEAGVDLNDAKDSDTENGDAKDSKPVQSKKSQSRGRKAKAK